MLQYCLCVNHGDIAVSKLWLSNGKIVLNADGKIAMCNDCPCTSTVDCSGHAIPTTLYATFGSDFAYLGTVPITYVADGTPYWIAGPLSASGFPLCASTPFWIRLFCDGHPTDANFTFRLSTGELGPASDLWVGYGTASTDPFYLTFTHSPIVITGADPSCATVSLSITFTETSP